MRRVLVRQSGLAGIRPSGKPVRADIRCGVRKLADQSARRQIVEPIKIFVVVRFALEASVAIREFHYFQPTVRAEARLEGMIRGIVDEGAIIRANGKKGRKAIDEGCSKSLIDPSLIRQVAIEIFRGVEGIVRFRDVERKNRGIEPGFVPVAQFHRFGELLAIHANFPGEQTGGIEFGFAVFVHGGLVDARQSVKREAPVLVQTDEAIVPQRGVLLFRVERIGDMLHDEGTVVLEVRAQVGRKRIDGLIDYYFLAVAAPSASSDRKQSETYRDRKASAEALL